MTDSSSDISLETEKEYGIRVLNIPLTINNKGYYERVDFTYDDFYKILNENEQIPCTSHITAPIFCDEFEKAYNEGYTDVIYVSINEMGSATYSASISGRDMFFEEHPEAKEKINIHFVPSRTFSFGYGWPVLSAAKLLREKNLSAEELVKFLKQELKEVDVCFIMQTLKFAKKSGRLSATSAFVGEMLGIRPLIIFREGKSVINEKVRGDKNIVSALANYYLKNVGENKDYYIITGEDEGIGDELENAIFEKTGKKALGRIKEGASISINAGPKVLAVVFHNKNKNEL